jgi:hypothetical protein
MWRFRGLPHYLDAQGERLGISKVLIDRARHNAEAHRISVLLGQLAERYHRLPREDDRALILGSERAQVQGTLGQCECELAKLHALAAAAQAMIDEAYAAFGLVIPERSHRVTCDFDVCRDPAPADLVPVKISPNGPRAAKAR